MGNKIFEEALTGIEPDIMKQVEWSMRISDRIAGILEERHISKEEFADLIDETKEIVTDWLMGRHNFTLSELAKISVALEKDLISVQ